jgi:Predicted ring-cleavage extradiol dioxygenase
MIAVKDVGRAKQFYHDVLGLEVISDFGANVTLTGGIALQTLDNGKSLYIGQQTRLFLEITPVSFTLKKMI